jgi:hypothetical protein
MKAPVTHINLLQRSAPAHAVLWTLVAVLALTLIGALYYGSQVRARAQEAQRQRDDVAAQVKDVQARMAAQTGQQARSAQSVELRKELDALQPQAQVAKALMDAVRGSEGGRTGEFVRALPRIANLNEPGLWLTGLAVGANGRPFELRGSANSGASVLRYARRVNDSLQPLAVRLDSLELQPVTATGAASGADAGWVTFRLY